MQAWNLCRKIHQGDIATESSAENIDKEIVPGMTAIYPSCIYTSVYIKYIYVYICVYIHIYIYVIQYTEMAARYLQNKASFKKY